MENKNETNEEMTELGKILDMFENAGFTVSYFQAYFLSRFDIAIKSESIKSVDDFQHEKATAGEIVSLMEKNGYTVIKYSTPAHSLYGTIYLEITPAET
jgi:nucleoside diphosphate kinase